MIDWWGVICNGFWISGLSTILAAFSYIHWWAHDQRMGLRTALSRREFRIPVIAGALLFGLGLLTTSQLWWERIGWGVVVLLLLWQAYSLLREFSRARQASHRRELAMSDSGKGGIHGTT